MVRTGLRSRKPAVRSYRPLFIISVEGSKTEPQYFAFFKRFRVSVECLSEVGKSSPDKVLKRIKKRVGEGIGPTDQAWVVVDHDAWTEKHFEDIRAWTKEDLRRGMAVSNPNFEYWLLLHFEDGDGLKSTQDCSRRLKECVPGYDKGVGSWLTVDRIRKAVSRGRQRDAGSMPASLPPFGTTAVWRLVNALLAAGEVP